MALRCASVSIRASAAVALVAATVLTVGAGSAAAATISPTTTADVVDAGDGLLSLREAVRQADETPGPDTVALSAGTEYVLDEACAEIQDGDVANTLDDLDHLGADDLTVTGDHSTIRQSLADSSCWQARVLDMGAGALTVTGVTLTGGHVDDPCWSYGAIGTGPLLCAQALGTHRGRGGAISADGPVVLDHTVITDNSAGDTAGGGVWSATSITATDSSVNLGDGSLGGGLAADGPITLERSTVAANRAVGVPHVATPSVARGGGVWATGAVTVRNSTVAANRVPGRVPVPVEGQPPMRLRGAGGAVWSGGRLELEHATVTGNRADIGSNLFVEDEGLGSFASVIGRGKPGARTCAVTGPSASQGYNVVLGAPCRLGAGPGDEVRRVRVPLGPLADNGGPTPTRLPGDTSLSIVAPSACTVLTVDQRGEARPQGPACEAGAVEVP